MTTTLLDNIPAISVSAFPSPGVSSQTDAYDLQPRIRKARLTDIPALIAMGQDFVASTEYKDQIVLDRNHCMVLLENLINSPNGCILVSTDGNYLTGMMGLVTILHLFSGECVVSELFWWMNPQYRGQGVGMELLEKAEQWSCLQGAKKLIMIAPNIAVEKLYQRHGYQRVEVSYQKEL